MSKPFLGVGTRFPLALDEQTGQLARAEYEESVRQSILVILGTAKGERVMRPDFGCGIHDLVFANASAGTIGRIAHEVDEALLRLEPRIEVLRVDARPGETSNVLLIDIEYQVRATNTAFNLVYPFYLQQGVGA
ncbi:MAG TPA: GPW/gp25 family protein [Gemmatimonadaceae bacterium]|jgi:phage baseplate assembly protein W|nr:GPW/gp25 family protein [Gemmatimonadaceae bacterium]